MAKSEAEFHDTDLIPWTKIEGVNAHEKILSKDPDTGDYTRIIMSQPDMDESIRDYYNPKSKMLVHDIWEEVFIWKGSIIDTSLDQTFVDGFYACRPPGMEHGPLFHPNGCTSIEFRYGGKHNKPELEFFDTRLLPWEKVEGAHGIYQKILSKDPVSGNITRLVKSLPDMDESIRDYYNPKSKVLVHDFWEEVIILRGTIICTTLNQTFGKGFFACRPPGMKHGPLFHPSGCLSLECRYYK